MNSEIRSDIAIALDVETDLSERYLATCEKATRRHPIARRQLVDALAALSTAPLPEAVRDMLNEASLDLAELAEEKRQQEVAREFEAMVLRGLAKERVA